jgi:superfamily II DNA/RNA helicase
MSDKTDHPPVPEAFAKLGVRPSILRALAEMKYETPSEIQDLLIPKALTGIDLLGQARTGTGKTAAFGIPILQRATRGLATQAIVLVPTRELAVQVDSELKRMAQFTPIRTVPVYGGQKIMAQMKFLKHGPEVLVGTPGRVIDLLDRRIINFDNIRFVVLDEVDRMLDIGFRDDIRNILSRVKGVRRRVFQEEGADEEQQQERPPARDTRGPRLDRDEVKALEADLLVEHTGDHGGDRAIDKGHGHDVDDGHVDPHADRGGHQTIFVSATFTEEIERLARRYMREPIEKLVAPGADDKPTVEKVEQYYLPVQPWDKYRLLRTLLIQENPDLAIVFCKTKRGAEKLAKRLHSDGIECREIHGNLAQNKRDRVMQGFRKGKFDVLIATDLASRGIDVADISHIINYDIPEDPEVYVHRIGRTARMGAEGKAFMFVGKEQGDELTKIENLINMVIPKAELEGFVPNPPPADWTEHRPGDFAPSGPAKPVVNRFQQVYGARPQPAVSGSSGDAGAPAAETPAVPLPPRTIGSKIPITRRHKRRR